MAFDAEEAAALVVSVPDELDFSADALVCVYLGERADPRMGAGPADSVAGGRGAAPPGARDAAARHGRPGADLPGRLRRVNRDALPVGHLAVRADDTISDEFIVGGDVTVPDAESAP